MLLILTGGPGQPGVRYLPRVLGRWAAPLADAYRIVMIDQRGTGAGALRCPALQQIMGSSDVKVPTASSVRSCAAAIGEKRRFFTTADTVADLDALREALGADKLTLNGGSYGSYVAERYALAHPDRVARLVLDSVVPHDGNGLALYTASMARTATVLRAVCRTRRCPGDPAADLAAIVRRDHNGPALQDMIVAMSVIDPTFGRLPSALHAARRGDRSQLKTLLRYVDLAEDAPAADFSQGLHAATLCTDLPFPWGRSDAPLATRKAALTRAAARLGKKGTWPYDAATAAGNGLAQTCLLWPPDAGPAAHARRRPPQRPDADPRRRPRPLDAARLGALGARSRARAASSSSSRAPATPRRGWPSATRPAWRRASSCSADRGRLARRPGPRKPRLSGVFLGGRCRVRTCDPQLVELVLSQLS